MDKAYIEKPHAKEEDGHLERIAGSLDGTFNYTILMDEADANTTYIGKATIGSATNQPLWQIQRASKSGNITTITFADGDDKFDNVWDDRVSLNYI